MRILLGVCLMASFLSAQNGAALNVDLARLDSGNFNLTAALDQIASGERMKQAIPGLAAVVLRDEHTIYAKGTGWASAESLHRRRH